VPITVEMGTKLIRLRYGGTCSQCASVLAPDTRGWWDSEARTATCVDCHPAEDDSRVQVAAPDQIQGMTNSDSITPLATGVRTKASTAGGEDRTEVGTPGSELPPASRTLGYAACCWVRR